MKKNGGKKTNKNVFGVFNINVEKNKPEKEM